MNSKEIFETEELASNKSKSQLINIQSYYFLQTIFNNITEKRALEIIKINKNIQNRLNIHINNYREYCELYTPIEIEMIPLQNKNGFFLNIQPEDSEPVQHEQGPYYPYVLLRRPLQPGPRPQCAYLYPLP